MSQHSSEMAQGQPQAPWGSETQPGRALCAGATCLLGLGQGFLCLDPTMPQGHPGSESQQLRLESVALAPGPEASDPRPNQARFSVSEPPDLVAVQRSLARQQSHL